MEINASNKENEHMKICEAQKWIQVKTISPGTFFKPKQKSTIKQALD